ncbi:MAG: LPS assembly lipoprotein LptE [Puniceicoccales bacterium]|nr:LPS assembly lipoprotein LptE [Puniceicoccales bacterium]
MRKRFASLSRPGALFGALALLLVTAFSGCGHYTLGSSAKPPFSSLNILPIENEIQAPQTQALLSQQLMDALSQESGVHIVSADGQATLRVRLVHFERKVASTRSKDTVLGNSFLLYLRARCTLVDNRTGKQLFKNREITASAEVHDNGAYNATEYQTMTVLSRDLARKIRDAVTGVW